jgi:aspartate carbamoyltransferase catalytic subunit
MQLRHLLSIKDLDADQIQSLFHQAALYKDRGFSPQRYHQATALVFAENSTRTRVSFERASQELGKPVVNLQPEQSSLEKGESLLDTLENIGALQCDLAIIRCTDEKLLRDTAAESPMAIINAGDGAREHPTQALLDLFTLWNGLAGRDWDELRRLRLAIVGDLIRSRVARSWAELAARLELKVDFISPAAWRPVTWDCPYSWSDDFKSRLGEWNAVMALRIQKERFRDTAGANEAEIQKYMALYQLGPRDFSSPEQKLMHPGPVNWGIELHQSLKNDPRSIILDQVNGGLFIRAALIEMYSSEGKKQ